MIYIRQIIVLQNTDGFRNYRKSSLPYHDRISNHYDVGGSVDNHLTLSGESRRQSICIRRFRIPQQVQQAVPDASIYLPYVPVLSDDGKFVKTPKTLVALQENIMCLDMPIMSEDINEKFLMCVHQALES